MATHTPVKAIQESGVSGAQPQSGERKPQGSPVARLLNRVSKWHGEYIDYQMEAGVWRKLAL